MNERAKAQTWYSSWFDTPYYHLLYKNRDEEEARAFINLLCQYLNLPAGSLALDLACGKGRHAKVMAENGLNVTGLDLSPGSIAEANKMANDRLHFFEHDMREVWKPTYFDVAFNLFTSFGYFDDQQEDQQVLEAIRTGLKPGGLFVFDYLHTDFVAETHVPSEEKQVEDIHFSIARHITADWIIKQISFEDAGNSYRFFEKVRNYSPEQLAALLHKSGFEILRSFGNYALEAPQPDSPRCIFIARSR